MCFWENKENKNFSNWFLYTGKMSHLGSFMEFQTLGNKQIIPLE